MKFRILTAVAAGLLGLCVAASPTASAVEIQPRPETALAATQVENAPLVAVPVATVAYRAYYRPAYGYRYGYRYPAPYYAYRPSVYPYPYVYPANPYGYPPSVGAYYGYGPRVYGGRGAGYRGRYYW